MKLNEQVNFRNTGSCVFVPFYCCIRGFYILSGMSSFHRSYCPHFKGKGNWGFSSTTSSILLHATKICLITCVAQQLYEVIGRSHRGWGARFAGHQYVSDSILPIMTISQFHLILGKCSRHSCLEIDWEGRDRCSVVS